MTWFLVSLVVLGTAFGDLLQVLSMRRHGEIHDFRPSAIGRMLAVVFRGRWMVASIGCFAVSFFGFMALLSVADVSFAVPATAAAYALETLLAKLFLKESIGSHRWAGAALVTLGVVLISL